MISILKKTSESGVSLLTGLGIRYGFNDAIAIYYQKKLTPLSQKNKIIILKNYLKSLIINT